MSAHGRRTSDVQRERMTGVIKVGLTEHPCYMYRKPAQMYTDDHTQDTDTIPSSSGLATSNVYHKVSTIDGSTSGDRCDLSYGRPDGARELHPKGMDGLRLHDHTTPRREHATAYLPA